MLDLQRTISVVGLGYVGLPVALAFSKKFNVIGYDINLQRINALQQGCDDNHDVEDSALKQNSIKFISDPNQLAQANFHIVTVPTPISDSNKPDLSYILEATQMLSSIIKIGDVVVFESTIYPGATEEICIPILEQSGLKLGIDFWVGYSPERINPGDHSKQFLNINKIVSGNDEFALAIISKTYASVVQAELFCANSIKIAEMAKLVENSQRDLNIAFMNEVSKICHKLEIDTQEVIKAASTKWNFMPFKPGLVGGHCISVDPYYLTYKAIQLGIRPEIILAGRKTNDTMGHYIAQETVKKMLQRDINLKNAKVGVLGVTFKENCRDIRNSRSLVLINELKSFGLKVLVHDPIVDHEKCIKTLGLDITNWHELKALDAIVLSVAHEFYIQLDFLEYKNKLNDNALIVDLKSILNPKSVLQHRIGLWRL